MGSRSLADLLIASAPLVAATIASGIHIVVNFFPDSFTSSKRLPYEVPEHLQYKMNQMAEQMNIPNKERIQIHIYNGLSALSVGSTSFPNGAVIGLPRTALGVYSENFQKNLLIGKKNIDPDDAKTNLLLRILEADDKRLSFQIAHELSHIKNNDHIIKTISTPALILSLAYSYQKGYRFVSKKLPQEHPLLFPIKGALVVGAIAAGFFINQAIDHYQEFSADETAARLSPELSDAAVEHLQRHILFNKWLCKEGAKGCDKDGNNSSDWDHPKATERLARLRAIQKDISDVNL